MNGHNGILHDNGDYEEIKIPVPWGHIAGKWWGPKGVQPIIAIHGWQDNAGTFDGLAPLLVKANFSILAIDLPGHGYSSHYPKGQYYYIFWDGLHFLRRVIKHFKWEKVTLLGHSLGGAVSFLYASVYPEEVDKYISIDIASPCVRDPKLMVKRMGESIDKFLKYETFNEEKSPILSYDEVVDILYDAYNGSLTKESCKIIMIRGTKAIDGGYRFTRDPRLKVAALANMTIDQALEMAGQITCEVMNIRGEPGMSFEKQEYYDLVLNKIGESAKKLEKVSVQGTHHMHLNNPFSISDSIVKFLRS